MQNTTTTYNLDISKYADITTGEQLSSILDADTSIKVVKNSHLCVIDSKDYFITDTAVVTHLLNTKTITVSDLGYIMIISKTLKTEYNAAFNHTIPHTLESLTELFGLTYDRTRKLIKKFLSKNILHKYVTHNTTLYCVNPYLTRKRKTISKELISIFSNFESAGSTASRKT